MKTMCWGAVIQKSRRINDLSQAELANRAGLQRKVIVDIESGNRLFSLAEFVAICRGLERDWHPIFFEGVYALFQEIKGLAGENAGQQAAVPAGSLSVSPGHCQQEEIEIFGKVCMEIARGMTMQRSPASYEEILQNLLRISGAGAPSPQPSRKAS